MSKQGFLKGLIFKDGATEQGSSENPSSKGKDFLENWGNDDGYGY